MWIGTFGGGLNLAVKERISMYSSGFEQFL